MSDAAERVFIALGSNVAPESHVPKALAELMRAVQVTAVSTLFESAALGRPGQPRFWNAVVEALVLLPPRRLKDEVLRPIEVRLGRVRSADRHAPRPIDLDLLLHGTRRIREPGLVLPDPEVETRPFLAIPLLELCPGLTLPGSTAPLAQAVERLDASGLEPLAAATQALRRLLASGNPGATGGTIPP